MPTHYLLTGIITDTFKYHNYELWYWNSALCRTLMLLFSKVFPDGTLCAKTSANEWNIPTNVPHFRGSIGLYTVVWCKRNFLGGMNKCSWALSLSFWLESIPFCSRTYFGKEVEVAAHTHMDSRRVEKPRNHWMLVTGNPRNKSTTMLDLPKPPSDDTRAVEQVMGINT